MTQSKTVEDYLIDSEISSQVITDKQPPSFKKLVRPALGIVAASLALYAGFSWWQHVSAIEDTDDAFISGHVHQLSARIAGNVTGVLVADNQHVKAGEVLVKIDRRDYQISSDSAKAAFLKAQWQALEARSTTISRSHTDEAQRFQAVSSAASASAQVHRAQAVLSEAKSGVLLAHDQVLQRQSELTRAQADFVRYKNLVQDRAVTIQSFDKAKQDKEVAEAAYAASEENYNQAVIRVHEAQDALADSQSMVVKARGTEKSAAASRADTDTSVKTVQVQEAAAMQAKAEYENALTQLSYTNIVAPVSGTIGHKTVEVGQQIDRGQALMSIVSDEKWVTANFKETQLGKMRVGQTVDIKVDAFPQKNFRGHVDSLSPASGAQFALLPADNASGNYTKVVQRVAVKIVFEPESIRGFESLLTPGMSVVPEVHISK
jgi:membrane fusion protein (multidrug efflux system)